MRSEVERYILIDVTLPDGSGGTADPDHVTEDMRQRVWDLLHREYKAIEANIVSVRTVYPGEVIGDE